MYHSNTHNNLNIKSNYFPYGKVLREYNPQTEKYLTTHHERDTETGLDYRGARYYDSDVARFLSLDPHAISYPTLSDYCYVGGNPISYIDPDGRDSVNVNASGSGAKFDPNKDTGVLPVFDLVEYKTASINTGGPEDNLGFIRTDGGLINKITGDILNATPLGVIDNTVAVFLDDQSTTDDKVNATLNAMASVLLSTRGGRGNNKLAPNRNAQGSHSTFSRGNNGKIYKYETYEKTNTGHFDPIKRYDGGKPNGAPGKPHINKKTGESISTPHVQGKSITGGVRKPTPDEIPNGN